MDRTPADHDAADLVDTDFLRALRNDDADFGLWPVRFAIPAGWRHTGFVGDFGACAAYVRALEGSSGAGAPAQAPGVLAGRVDAALHRWPRAAALADAAGVTTYADLDDGRTAVAGRLRAGPATRSA